MKSVYTHTPLWESKDLADLLGVQVYLKMEAFQPAGSFKSRGMGAACLAAYDQGIRQVVCSSGGNAGLAVAYAGRILGMQVTIIVPKTTSERARNQIQREGAAVRIHGEAWDDAHAYALEYAAETGSAYIHPFDDPVIWQGHSTIIDEIQAEGVKPGVLVASVGGGGLLTGLLLGLDKAGWRDIPVLAVETHGANSFSRSFSAGKLITLDAITSVATTLGAKTVCQQVLDASLAHNVQSLEVSDRDAVDACVRFATEHRVLVEPACGAALAVGYKKSSLLKNYDPVVFIVCGGAAVTPEILAAWDQQV